MKDLGAAKKIFGMETGSLGSNPNEEEGSTLPKSRAVREESLSSTSAETLGGETTSIQKLHQEIDDSISSNATIRCSKESTRKNKKHRARLLQHALSLSLSDSGIANCNRMFWEKCKENEALRLWALGRELGVTHQGDETLMVDKFLELERRDATYMVASSSYGMGQQEVNP